MIWRPVSACGDHCLRGERVVPAGPVRRAARVCGLAGVTVAAGLVLPLLPRAWRGPAMRLTARATLGALGVRWRLRGRLPRRHALVVANHVSWLDIVVLLAAGQQRVVAKAEVRDWPVVGRIAASVGAVFLDPMDRLLGLIRHDSFFGESTVTHAHRDPLPRRERSRLSARMSPALADSVSKGPVAVSY